MMKGMLFAVLAFLTLAVPVQANMLTNGDFNTGDLSGWWTWADDPDNQNAQIEPAGDYNYDGTANARLWSATSVWEMNLGQDVAIGENTPYSLSFVYSARWTDSWGSASVAIDYYDADWTWIDYEWFALYNEEPGPNAEGEWLSYSGDFTTVTGTAFLSLKFQAANWTTVYFDNVSLVPEPATLVLFAAGGLAMLRRKRS